MTSSEKLLNKEFNIKTQQEFFDMMKKQPKDFYAFNFDTKKSKYVKMIKSLIKTINFDAECFAEYKEMVKTETVLKAAFPKGSIAALKMQDKDNRRKLVNHVRFFI